MILLGLLGILCVTLAVALSRAGRSPHVLLRPEEIGLGLSDIAGAGVVVDEVVKTLHLFQAHDTFRKTMGGTPRRAVLFEGPPGAGKTHVAKAMAAEAGVPFLLVSSSAFQSVHYGFTNRKIRSYFKALRACAHKEGGAIGFIEDLDVVAAGPPGTGESGREGRAGHAGVVNELVVQLQSFDIAPAAVRARRGSINLLNRCLRGGRRLPEPAYPAANILLVGATSRAGDLDPALLRPGRFDRTVVFDLPGCAGRREIIDYYLARKRHEPVLDFPEYRDTLAATTSGYSPMMLEHLLDEGLVWALRRGADSLSWEDLQRAKMTAELGLVQPVAYAEQERVAIATHEAGHAVTAWLVAPDRRLEVLSIVKRSTALGLLAHSGTQERWTRTRREMAALVRIAMGGMVAEEICLGDTSSGVAGDLQAATETAAQMIGSFGMAGSLVSLDAMHATGAANIVAKVMSDGPSREKLDTILDSARADVRELLTDFRYLVDALRDALLQRDELIGIEIEDVLRAAVDTHAFVCTLQPGTPEPLLAEEGALDRGGASVVDLRDCARELGRSSLNAIFDR